MTHSDIAAALAGEGMMTKDTGVPDRPSRDEVARLAYHFYETRGRHDGHDVDDWLSAEQELTRHYRQITTRNRSTRKGTSIMKLVIIGGTGLIGSKLVIQLREHGHEAVPASPDTGVNTLTGAGLPEVLQGASVVVDVSNSPSFEEKAVMDFFTTATRNILKYAAAAGVTHYVALSVVGTERIPDSPYLRAKNAQETLIKGDGIPYSIVHATQFFEFVKRIADDATVGTTVRVPPVLFQPMAADDVAKAVGRVAVGAPVNGTIEVAGPQQFRFDELIRKGLAASSDPRGGVVDPHARDFGSDLGERSLVPAGEAELGEIRFEEWLGQPVLSPR